MELLRPFLIFGLIHFLACASGNPVTTISPKESFLEFYDQELSSIAEKFCEKAINLSEKLLKDKEIKEASSGPLKEFKEYLEHLQQDYPHFKRFKLYQPLLAVLINTVNIETINNFDPDYENYVKFKEIAKQYFAELLQEYEENYKKFIQEKFLPKSEELTQQLKEEDLQKMPKFQKMMENLRNCQDYRCFPLYLDKIFIPMNVSQDLLVKYSKIDLRKTIILTVMRINNYGPSLLNNEKFLQLSKETQTKFIEDVNDFNTKFKNNNDIYEFLKLFGGKMHYIQKYDNIDNVPLEDRKIWKEILTESKSAANKDKYKIETGQVMENLFSKMMYTLRLMPEDDLKPYYQFMGLPYKKHP